MLQQFLFFAITAFLIPLSLIRGLASDSAAPANPAAERGYRFLTDTALIPAERLIGCGLREPRLSASPSFRLKASTPGPGEAE